MGGCAREVWADWGRRALLPPANLLLGIHAVRWKLAGVVDRWLERRQERRERKQLERAALARRADEQNAQVVAGDDRGIYGEYRPHEDFPPVATDQRAEGM